MGSGASVVALAGLGTSTSGGAGVLGKGAGAVVALLIASASGSAGGVLSEGAGTVVALLVASASGGASAVGESKGRDSGDGKGEEFHGKRSLIIKNYQLIIIS